MNPQQVFVSYDREASQPEGRFNYCPFCGKELVLQAHDNELRPACPQCGFVQFQNPAPAVSVLIVQEERVLLGKRTGSVGGGKWALPSGYLEYGEDFLTAGIREVKEETGLEVEILSIVNVISSFFAPGYHFLAIYLLAQVIGGELGAADDLQAAAWFPLAGPLPEMAFAEDISVIEQYAAVSDAGLAVDARYARKPPTGEAASSTR